MNIAYVIDNLRGDGTQRILTQLVQGLAERGHKQKVLCLNNSYDEAIVRELQEAAVEIRIVGKMALAGGYGLLATRSWMNREGFDVIVTMLFAADVVGRFLARWTGGPRIVSSLRARNVHYSRLQRWLVRVTMDVADAVVINSPHSMQFAIDVEGAKRERMFLIPNGINVSKYTKPMGREVLREEFEISNRGWVLGCVGRLTRQKGIDVLLEALSLTSHRDFTLLIFGSGEEEFQLRALTRKLGLESQVHFAGYRGDLPSLLGALDLYVHPARFEGMPNAVLEAMAAACPIVATAVDGSLELIEDGRDGWLVPPDDAPGLATAIDTALSDLHEARRRGTAARERVSEHFSVDKMVMNWEKVLSGERPRL